MTSRLSNRQLRITLELLVVLAILLTIPALAIPGQAIFTEEPVVALDCTSTTPLKLTSFDPSQGLAPWN